MIPASLPAWAASAGSALLIALYLARGRSPMRLIGDALAIGLTLGATLAAALAPFELRANPLHFSPLSIAFLFAGLPEEGAKMLSVAAFLRFHYLARDRRDVVFAAGALSLAFAGLENLLYLVNASTGWAALAFERAVTAMPFHVFEGLAGGFAVAFLPPGRRGTGLAVAAWIGLAAIHGFYDFAVFAGADGARPPAFWTALVAALGGNPATLARACLSSAEIAAALLGLGAALRVAPNGPVPTTALRCFVVSRGLGVALGALLAGGAGLALLAAATTGFLLESVDPFVRASVFAVLPLALGLAFWLAPAPPASPLTRKVSIAGFGLAACAVVATALVFGPGQGRNLRALRYEARGDRLAARGDYAGAAEAFGQALAVAPARIDALSRRAAASAALNRLDAASADLDAAVRLAPQDSRLRVQRADIDRRRNAPAEAAEDLGAALQTQPGNPQLLALRATARLEAGDEAGARGDLAEARQIAPADAIVRRALASAEVDAGDFDGALRELNAALHADPADIVAAFQRGRVYFYKGDFARAADDLARAGGRAGDLYPALWRFLAEARAKRGGATSLLQSLSAAPPDWPAPVARMLLGLQSPADARAAAADDGQRCEADFYFAMSKLGAAGADESRGRLEALVKLCPSGFVEHEGARAELRAFPPL